MSETRASVADRAPDRPPDVPPGPRGYPVVGVLPRIWRDPLRFFEEVAAQHGGLARVGLGKFTLYLVSEPAHVQHILQDNAQNYWKGAGLEAVEPVMGKGLAVSEGELWLRQRRLMQPAFRRARLLEATPAIVAAIDAALSRLEAAADAGRGDGRSSDRPSDRPIDLAAVASELVQRVIFTVLFGEHLTGDPVALGRALVEVNAFIDHAAWAMVKLPAFVPTPRRVRFRRAQATLDALVYELIARRRRAGASEGDPDLLSRLLGARDPKTGEGMTDRQVRDEVMTLFVAGHDTTASALAWTVHALGEAPEVRERLEAEVDGVVGERRPTAADLPRLELTERVLRESMRLYPPGWVIVRTPRQEDEIGGYRVPPGAPLLISQWVVHRRPDLWPDPLRFDPDRFLPDRAAARPRFAYFPYGGGNRLCIGSLLADVTLQLALTRLVQRFRLEPVPGHRVVPQPLTTLRPKHGVRVRVRRR